MNGARGPEVPVDDMTLMELVSAGDAGALAALYERHAGLVFSLCLRVLGNPADAEELLVDVFFEAWERAGRYDAARGSPRTYLLTLARSRSIDRLRSRLGARPADVGPSGAHRPISGATSVADDPLAQTLAAERRVEVQRALATLDPNQRAAIECSFFDGLSHGQIAEKLQKPLGTVKTYIRQGLLRLRDSLGK